MFKTRRVLLIASAVLIAGVVLVSLAFAQDNALGPGEPSRSFRLESVQGDSAFGIVYIFPAWGDNHPQFPGFPTALNYNVHELRCQGGNFDPFRARLFYAVYLTTETVPRTRIQSFNTSCAGKRFSSYATLPGYSEQTLLTEDLVVEIIAELDDGENTPDFTTSFVALRGEELGD